jgi:hypothetical protein
LPYAVIGVVARDGYQRAQGFAAAALEEAEGEVA